MSGRMQRELSELAVEECWRQGPPIAQRRSAFFFSSRRRHTRFDCDWSSDVCSSDLGYNRIHITFVGDSKQDPSTFGINNGLSGPVGLPQMAINELGLTFGGIRNFQIGRASCRERV